MTAPLRPAGANAAPLDGEAVAPRELRRGDYAVRVRAHQGAFDPSRARRVITVHGLSEGHDVWAGLVAGLAHRFRSGMALSLPWHNEDGSLWGLAAEPQGWIAEGWRLLPDGPKIVLAHSFGANALLAAIDAGHVRDVDALVLVSPYYKADYAAFGWDLFKRYVDEFEEFVRRSVRARPGGERLGPAALATVVEKVKEKYGSFSWMEFYALFARTPGLSLRDVVVPTLVVGGDADLSIDPADLAALAGRLPRGRHRVLAGCGHFAMLERQAQVQRYVEEFLADLEEPGRRGQAAVHYT